MSEVTCSSETRHVSRTNCINERARRYLEESIDSDKSSRAPESLKSSQFKHPLPSRTYSRPADTRSEVSQPWIAVQHQEDNRMHIPRLQKGKHERRHRRRNANSNSSTDSDKDVKNDEKPTLAQDSPHGGTEKYANAQPYLVNEAQGIRVSQGFGASALQNDTSFMMGALGSDSDDCHITTNEFTLPTKIHAPLAKAKGTSRSTWNARSFSLASPVHDTGSQDLESPEALCLSHEKHVLVERVPRQGLKTALTKFEDVLVSPVSRNRSPDATEFDPAIASPGGLSVGLRPGSAGQALALQDLEVCSSDKCAATTPIQSRPLGEMAVQTVPAQARLEHYARTSAWPVHAARAIVRSPSATHEYRKQNKQASGGFQNRDYDQQQSGNALGQSSNLNYGAPHPTLIARRPFLKSSKHHVEESQIDSMNGERNTRTMSNEAPHIPRKISTQSPLHSSHLNELRPSQVGPPPSVMRSPAYSHSFDQEAVSTLPTVGHAALEPSQPTSLFHTYGNDPGVSIAKNESPISSYNSQSGHYIPPYKRDGAALPQRIGKLKKSPDLGASNKKLCDNSADVEKKVMAKKSSEASCGDDSPNTKKFPGPVEQWPKPGRRDGYAPKRDTGGPWRSRVVIT